MKIELRGISLNKTLSEETFCYSATLYIDGVKAGSVANRGHGGPDETYLLPTFNLRDLNEKIAASIPATEAFGMTLEATLEMECHRLVGEFEFVRDMQRLMKRAIVVLEGNEVRTFTYKGVKALTPQHVESFRKQRPELSARMLNGKDAAALIAAMPQA